MKIHFLKEDALIALKANVSANLANYRKPTNEWIYEYFQGEDPFMEANFECEDFQLLLSPNTDQFSATDVQNARILYSALKNLTDTQATDERLWAGLCHYEFWDYMYKRLKMNAEEKMEPRTVLGRYFFNTAKKRALSLNTISKLWWIGRWVYDSNRTDPFELLKYFETDFVTKLYMIFSNNYMNNREIALGMIEALMMLENEGYELTESDNSKQTNVRQIFLKATSFLNVFGGTHILDYFTKDEIKAKVIEYMLSLPHTLKEGVSINNPSNPDKMVSDNSEQHYPSVPTVVIDSQKSEPVHEAVPQNELSKPEQPQTGTDVQPTQTNEPVRRRRRHKPDSTPAPEVSVPKMMDQQPLDELPGKNKTDPAPAEVRMDTQMDDKLVDYCENMRLSYSYKVVLLLALLENVESDGKMDISRAVPFFRKFYRERTEKGFPSELKTGIYSDLSISDSRILGSITKNPLYALLLSNFFEYDSNTGRFGFKADVWSGITENGRARMKEAANARLARYFQEL